MLADYVLQVNFLGHELAELGSVMRSLTILIESMMALPQKANIYSPHCSQGHPTQCVTPEDQVMPWIKQLPSEQVQTWLTPEGLATITTQGL